MSPVLALLVGALLMLLCGGASLWLAKAMLTSRMESLSEENASLRRELTAMQATERMRKQIVAVQRAVVSGNERLEKLDTNVFRLTQVVTGEVALTNGSGRAFSRNPGTDPTRYTDELQAGLPDGLTTE